MQKIKIKSTILVAILIAIFSTIMCMGFVSAEELPSDSIGENIPDLIGGISKHINYYDKSGALIKTEGLLTGNNMTGIEGYEGNYVVRTDNYEEVSQFTKITIPSEDYIKENFVYSTDARAYNYLNNSLDFTNNPDLSSLILQESMYYDNDDNLCLSIQFWLNNLLGLTGSVKMNSKISIDGATSKIYTNSIPGTTFGISFSDRTSMPAVFKFTSNVDRIFEFTSIFDDQSTYSSNGDTVKYVYYYMNETMSLDELTALNMDNVMSDTINVYTDIEPAQEPEEPTDEPTDKPSGDENGDIILPPSDKPSDTNKPSDETPIKEQNKLEKSNAELKAQWTALLAHDWQNANGWQLVTLMTITLAVVIAIIVAIPVVCHQVKKATNVKRIKARSVARKR